MISKNLEAVYLFEQKLAEIKDLPANQDDMATPFIEKQAALMLQILTARNPF